MRGLLTASLTLAVGSGIAFAQPAEGEEGAAGAEGAPAEGAPAEGGAEGGEAMPAETPPAEEMPAPAPAGKPGLVLPKGKINITATVEMNMSKEAVMKPFSIAPDIHYGVTPELQVSLIHSGFGVTGLRAAAGNGLCLAGEENNCALVYRNVGGEALYQFMKGPLTLAGQVGVHDQFIKIADETKMNLKAKIGLRGRYSAGQVSVMFNPAVGIGINAREDQGNKEILWLPVAAAFQVNPMIQAGAAVGVATPLEEAGDLWTLRLGVFAGVKINPQLNAGVSFALGNVAGGELGHPDGIGAFDARFLQIWAGYTI